MADAELDRWRKLPEKLSNKPTRSCYRCPASKSRGSSGGAGSRLRRRGERAAPAGATARGGRAARDEMPAFDMMAQSNEIGRLRGGAGKRPHRGVSRAERPDEAEAALAAVQRNAYVVRAVVLSRRAAASRRRRAIPIPPIPDEGAVAAASAAAGASSGGGDDLDRWSSNSTTKRSGAATRQAHSRRAATRPSRPGGGRSGGGGSASPPRPNEPSGWSDSARCGARRAWRRVLNMPPPST